MSKAEEFRDRIKGDLLPGETVTVIVTSGGKGTWSTTAPTDLAPALLSSVIQSLRSGTWG